jgi:transposase
MRRMVYFALRQVHGVGALSALTFVLTLEDPSRFAKSRQVGPYLGLVPATNQSGKSDPQKRISKQGNQLTRKLLVICAHYTYLVPSARTPTSGATVRRSLGEAERRTPRNEQWWRWRGSSRCCCIAYGLRRRSTYRSTSRAVVDTRQPERASRHRGIEG